MLVVCLAFQQTQFSLLAGDHFVIFDAHLLYQGLLVLLRRIPSVILQCGPGGGIQTGTFILHKRSRRIHKFKLALIQIVRGNKSPCHKALMHTKIVCQLTIFEYCKPIAAIHIAGKGRDKIILSGNKCAALWSPECNDGLIVGYFRNQHLTIRDYESGCACNG